MRKRIILLTFAICAVIQTIAQNQIAIYVVGKTTDSYKKVVASALTQAVNNDGHFQAVERTADFLSALGAEISFQESGAVSQITELGRQLGAQYVFIVDLDYVLGELYASSRIINVENNIVLASSGYGQPITDTNSLRNLATKIASSTLAELPKNKVKNQRLNGYRNYLSKIKLFGPFTSAYRLSKFKAPAGYRIANRSEISDIRKAKRALGETDVVHVARDIITTADGYGGYKLTYTIDSSHSSTSETDTEHSSTSKRVVTATVQTAIGYIVRFYNGEKGLKDYNFNLEDQIYVYCIRL